MGAMFRSEEMALAQLFIQPEAAYPSLSEIGEIGVVQFRDLNPDVSLFQRNFINEVRRCDEMERKLRYVTDEIKSDEIDIPELQEIPKAPNPRQMTEIEAQLEKVESEVKELSENAINLKSDFLELIELSHVLKKAQSFLFEQGESNADPAHKALMTEQDSQNVSTGKLGFVAGVANRDRIPGLERMLWRISRGNVFLRRADIEETFVDPTTKTEMLKTVFVAFFQGEQLKNRVKKVCSGYRASLYPCPGTSGERSDMLKGVNTRLEDLKMVLNTTEDHRRRVLITVSKELQYWSCMVCKMKAIYHTLNFFNKDVTTRCLIGECWIPSTDIAKVQLALEEGSRNCGSSVHSFLNVITTNENPPTYVRTNKFTRGFQNLIDAYGLSTYRECNPALYSIVTFPFLFAVMFGDLGHGFILTLFGLYLCIWEKKLIAKKIKNEIWTIFFGGRYIILLMGFFSMYTGFIYNDLFSKSMNIFGSAWTNNVTAITAKEMLERGEFWGLDPKSDYQSTPYPVGLDPMWNLAPKNKIVFLNTFKMKLSIIFGVVHMIFGLCVGVVNYVHFGKLKNVFLDFIPQMLFLICLFVWMVVMIIIKWLLYSAENEGKYGTYCSPSVLIYFINMMLLKEGSPFEGCEEFMFDGQKILQQILLVVAVLCIPVLLFSKPLFIKLQRKKNGIEVQATPSSEEHGHDDESGPMSEIMIQQAIHTIEYALSTISHTASYLRLWALSLAHAQLSEVLWNMVLHKLALSMNSYIGAVMLFLAFAFWAAATISILVMMEGLSAFLHTLRLHWVEFMSKFFSGLGYPFEPFSFKVILEAEDNEEEE